MCVPLRSQESVTNICDFNQKIHWSIISRLRMRNMNLCSGYKILELINETRRTLQISSFNYTAHLAVGSVMINFLKQPVNTACGVFFFFLSLCDHVGGGEQALWPGARHQGRTAAPSGRTLGAASSGRKSG